MPPFKSATHKIFPLYLYTSTRLQALPLLRAGHGSRVVEGTQGSGRWFTFLCSELHRYTPCDADPPSNKSYGVSERFSIPKLIPTRDVNHPLPRWFQTVRKEKHEVPGTGRMPLLFKHPMIQNKVRANVFP